MLRFVFCNCNRKTFLYVSYKCKCFIHAWLDNEECGLVGFSLVQKIGLVVIFISNELMNVEKYHFTYRYETSEGVFI